MDSAAIFGSMALAMWSLRKTAIGLSVVLLGGLGLYGLLLGGGQVARLSTYALDLARVRNLALAPRSELPLRLRVEKVADASVPSALLVAGTSLFSRKLVVYTSYQVVYPDGATVVIDGGPDRRQHAATPFSGAFRAVAYRAVQKALERADAIVVTHEHVDHLGAIATSPSFERFAGQLRLTRAQLDNRPGLRRAGLSQRQLARLQALDVQRYHRLAPGIVLIAAPGHSPGSQLIYLRLQGGAEYLLVGDVAFSMDNIELPRGRPLLTSRFVLQEDARAVSSQLRVLHELRRRPLHLLVSHDGVQLARARRSGLLQMGFE